MSNLRNNLGLVLSFVILFLLASCDTELTSDQKKQLEIDKIVDFLSEKELEGTVKTSGLYCVSIIEGVGDSPVDGDTVWIDYIASDLNDVVFDTTNEDEAKDNGIYNNEKVYEPFKFVVGSGSVIRGVDEGVEYMKLGGELLCVIPSNLAYKDDIPLAYKIILTKVAKSGLSDL